MGALHVVTYVLAAVFVIFFVAKMYKYAKMPIHLRWELYPLVGETKRPWGGSYLEEPDWWKKPHEEKSFIAEMKFMGQEIIFFKEYFHRNRSLWYIVFPFHIGVFLFATSGSSSSLHSSYCFSLAPSQSQVASQFQRNQPMPGDC